MKSIIFRPAAAADVEDAYEWYEAKRARLGEEFLSAVRTVLESIRAHPEQCPVIRRQTRRALLRRFPYGLYYRVFEEQIIVVACFHAKRDPRRWQSRK